MGPQARISCSVYSRDMELAEHFDTSSLASAGLLDFTSLIFTDASDHATGTFLTEGPRCDALRARRETLYAFGSGSLVRWRMLPEADFIKSSTYRELLAVLDAHTEGVFNTLLQSIVSPHSLHQFPSRVAYPPQRLLPQPTLSRSSSRHLASSLHPPHHSTRSLLLDSPGLQPVCRPRVEGPRDYRIDFDISLAFDSVLHFSLDLFASECERDVGNPGSVPFAPLFQSDDSVGNGLHTPPPISGATWVFPPSPLIHLATARCPGTPGGLRPSHPSLEATSLPIKDGYRRRTG